MVSIERVINDLLKYYSENCKGKTMEYSYGFFDALGVLRDIRRELQLDN